MNIPIADLLSQIALLPDPTKSFSPTKEMHIWLDCTNAEGQAFKKRIILQFEKNEDKTAWNLVVDDKAFKASGVMYV